MVRSVMRRLMQIMRIVPREQPRSIPAHVQRHDDAGDPLHKSAQGRRQKQGIQDYEVVPDHAEGAGPYSGG